MAQVINPKVVLRILGTETIVISDAHVSFDIQKDLEDEPNEATVTIYNLNADTRNNVINTDLQDVPIEIYLSEHGTEDIVLAFLGEIDTVKNRNNKPGYVTELTCYSQKVNHQNKFIEPKSYAKGTAINQIIQDFVDVIALPYNLIDVPTDGILLGQSFSGPAFRLLRKFCEDFGYFVYILDGVLNISSVYDPIDTSSFEIRADRLIYDPIPTERVDAIDIEMRTIVEMSGLESLRSRKKIKRKKKVKGIVYNVPPKGFKTKRYTENDLELLDREALIKDLPKEDYIEYDAADMVITGKDFELFLVPTLQPDQIINVEGDSSLYRIREVNLYGDNFGGDYMVSLKTDDYEAQ